MKEIILLVDYKNVFGSKYDSVPYRSGLDKQLLSLEFEKFNITVKYMSFSDVDFSQDWKDKVVLYTSSEDNKYKYKSYIEDIIYGLELKGAIVIPKYSHLRANNNKVFMEILRASILNSECGNDSQMFGTLEELKKACSEEKVKFPCVIKTAEGACSTGVARASNENELFEKTMAFSVSKDYRFDLRDYVRSKKHSGYTRESMYRSKFIVQPMIEGLNNDWKLLIFGNKIYNLKRHVRKNDFRASGSHNDYRMGSESGLTSEMMDFAYDIYKKLNVPMLSFDLAFDGSQNYMIEFQSLYFGSSTFILSKDYYALENGEWVIKEKEGTYEALFAWSIDKYLRENSLK